MYVCMYAYIYIYIYIIEYFACRALDRDPSHTCDQAAWQEPVVFTPDRSVFKKTIWKNGPSPWQI